MHHISDKTDGKMLVDYAKCVHGRLTPVVKRHQRGIR